MIKKIDINKIRGRFQEMSIDGKSYAGGDDTDKSLKLLADKINEIIDELN